MRASRVVLAVSSLGSKKLTAARTKPTSQRNMKVIKMIKGSGVGGC